MTPRSTTAEEHLEIAITLLAQAEREFLAGDIIQGSEKLWGAASHAMLAAAKQRGWVTGSHRATVDACRRLAQERGEPLLEGGFAIAERFHMCFYDPARFYPVTADGDPQNSHEMVAQFVHLVLDIVRAS
jgi:hypothetical protein